MNTLERLKGVSLEWNDKDGTIDIADDMAGQNKTRVIAEIHDREYGPALVNAANAFPELVEALGDLLSHFAEENPFPDQTHGTILFKWSDLTKARAALEWAKE